MSPVLNLEIVKPPPKWRTLLILGRVSNLPTVWSNCLAGWWLGGGGRRGGLLAAMAAVSCLYIGGMFLNDAFDVDFDRRHRKLRPIPSGAIPEQEVWRWGGFWMGAGMVALLWMGWTTAVLTVALAGAILVYNAMHKLISFGPALMGLCRFLVYLVAAAAGNGAVTGRVIWPALALGFYVAGLSCLARKESGAARPPIWPVALLIAPVGLGALINDQPQAGGATGLTAVAAVWMTWSVAQTFWRQYPRIGATVSRLLAGIALVDWLAALPPEGGGWGFPLCFVLALFLQRFVPAT